MGHYLGLSNTGADDDVDDGDDDEDVDDDDDCGEIGMILCRTDGFAALIPPISMQTSSLFFPSLSSSSS